MVVMDWLILIFVTYVCMQQRDTQAHGGYTYVQEICQRRLLDLMNAYEKTTTYWLYNGELPPRLDSKRGWRSM